MARVKIGIVGAGEITRKMHLPVLLSIPEVEIAWLFDNRQSHARSVGAAYGVPPVQATNARELPPCDVALLAIPVEARGDYLDVFCARQTAVFCEKPFAASATEHKRIAGQFSSHRLGSAYQRRFYRSTVLLREILDKGWFGPLRSIAVGEGDRSRGSGVDHSFLDDGSFVSTRGVLFDLGTHAMDLVLYLTSAVGYEVLSSEVIFDGGVDRKVTAAVKLQAPGTGSIALDYRVSWLDRQTNIIQLQFDRATLWSTLAPSGEVFLGDPRTPSRCVALAGSGGAATANQSFYLEWRAFLDGLRTGTDSPVAARTSLLTTALMEEVLARGRVAGA